MTHWVVNNETITEMINGTFKLSMPKEIKTLGSL